MAEFDELSLWAHKEVWFSSSGTLLSTAAARVETAGLGSVVEELDTLLHVGTKDPVRTRVRTARVTREHLAGRFCPARRTQAAGVNHCWGAEPGVAGPLPEPALLPEELRAAIVLCVSVLDEKQRRLYAGLEALNTGPGGDARIAALLGFERGNGERCWRTMSTSPGSGGQAVAARR